MTPLVRGQRSNKYAFWRANVAIKKENGLIPPCSILLTMSGNITTMVADHFAQFLLIKKCHISYKSCSYYTFDYTNFAEEKFVYDYSNID